MVRLAIAALLVVIAGPARADFCLLTQNGLHLGQGEQSYAEDKRQHFRRIFQDYDVVVLQEVMKAGEPKLLTPEGFNPPEVSEARGQNSYREHYAVLTRQGITVLARGDYPDTAQQFARPPFGVAVQDKDGARYWVVDIHAIFGKGGKEPRRQEVAAMAQVLAHFAALPLPDGSTIDRVLVAGDWNLSSEDRAFGDLAAALPGTVAAPEIKTSLNKDGVYSSPYDHVVWNRRHLSVDFASDPRDTGGLATDFYRTTVSDHAGVAGYVMSAPDKQRPEGIACPPARRQGES